MGDKIKLMNRFLNPFNISIPSSFGDLGPKIYDFFLPEKFLEFFCITWGLSGGRALWNSLNFIVIHLWQGTSSAFFLQGTRTRLSTPSSNEKEENKCTWAKTTSEIFLQQGTSKYIFIYKVSQKKNQFVVREGFKETFPKGTILML